MWCKIFYLKHQMNKYSCDPLSSHYSCIHDLQSVTLSTWVWERVKYRYFRLSIIREKSLLTPNLIN